MACQGGKTGQGLPLQAVAGDGGEAVLQQGADGGQDGPAAALQGLPHAAGGALAAGALSLLTTHLVCSMLVVTASI